ncbi:keratin-associated protein 15-1-like [Cavia porcellus]|uniref:keratin-associated protein 15-1-like n=1 Tax=Cavia porcellus TaxID=10141 RepID=UPI00035141D2|nr:keratin-associated protein 15-1-like [Cavia porcellus]
MPYNFSSGHFGSQSLGGFLRPSVSTYNAVYPSNVIIPPKTYQLGSSVYGGQQESFSEPINSPTSFTGTRFVQPSFARPSNFISSFSDQTNYFGSVGYGTVGLGPFGRGNTGFQSL